MYQAPGINHKFIIENNNIQAFQIKINEDKKIIVKKVE
jgi:hypothetical protein